MTNLDYVYDLEPMSYVSVSCVCCQSNRSWLMCCVKLVACRVNNCQLVKMPPECHTKNQVASVLYNQLCCVYTVYSCSQAMSQAYSSA